MNNIEDRYFASFALSIFLFVYFFYQYYLTSNLFYLVLILFYIYTLPIDYKILKEVTNKKI